MVKPRPECVECSWALLGDMGRGHRRNENTAAPASLHLLSVLVVLAIASGLLLNALTPRREKPISVAHQQDAMAFPFLALSLSGDAGVTETQQRALFPYSVIPRGVTSAKELQMVVERDAVVAAHYAGFAAGRARVVRAKRNRAVYVSYRLGNRVFWTKNKMLVPRGETLITDGEHTARTRCGNRISDTPMAPVSLAEPPANKLNEPSRPSVPSVPLDPYDPPVLWTSNDSPGFSPLSPGPVAPGSGIYIPPVPPIFCCSGGGAGSRPPVVTPPVVPPPPVPTPEPGTLLLAVIGLTTACLLRKK